MHRLGRRATSSWFTPPRIAALVSVSVFGVLVGALFNYQILQGAHYKTQSKDNYAIRVPLRAARGEIVDAQESILASSRQSFSICAVPKTTLKNEQEISRLAGLLGIEEDFIRERLSRTAMSYRPAVVLRDVDFATLSAVEELSAGLPDIIVVAEPVRSYPGGECFCHLVGYVGEVTQEEVARDPEHCKPGALIGRSGVEMSYNHMLSGEEGYKMVNVSMDGDEVPLDYEDVEVGLPTEGRRVRLSVHSGLQVLADSLLGESRGCVIVLGVKTGEVLALVSTPAFDQTLFATGISTKDWRSIIEDQDKPLLNRAIQCAYPPGSTYKLVTAAAALERRLVNESTRFKSCYGAYKFGRRTFKCWKPEGHGSSDLIRAITVSCDVYFYQVGERLRLEDFASYGDEWRLADPTGIDIPNEVTGLIPDVDYYDRTYGKGQWTRGIMLNLAIGQGEILVTPLSLLSFVCAVANDGVCPVPHCVKSTGTGDRESFVPAGSVEVPISYSTCRTLKKAMREVVESDEGTGRAARVPGYEVAGKTGTAQNPHGEDHAWFVCYAPFETPEIAVCVMVENAGHGGAVAAPIAGRLLRLYFEERERGRFAMR